MRAVLIAAAVLLLPAVVQAQEPTAAPAYQRMRHGADQWHARGGGNQHWRGGHDRGYVDPYFFAPPIIAGSWYERPYPYHFDYYRHRWGGPSSGYGTAAEDCPCATPPPVEVVE